MSDREKAEELVELVCKALGTSLRHYTPVTKQMAVSDTERWLRDYVPEGDDW
jgi:hypothetical protein